MYITRTLTLKRIVLRLSRVNLCQYCSFINDDGEKIVPVYYMYSGCNRIRLLTYRKVMSTHLVDLCEFHGKGAKQYYT